MLLSGNPQPDLRLVLTGLTSLEDVRQCEPANFLFASESSIHGHQGGVRYRHEMAVTNGAGVPKLP